MSIFGRGDHDFSILNRPTKAKKNSEIIKNKNWIYKILTLLWDFGDLVFKPIGFDGISTNLDKIKFFVVVKGYFFGTFAK